MGHHWLLVSRSLHFPREHACRYRFRWVPPSVHSVGCLIAGYSSQAQPDCRLKLFINRQEDGLVPLGGSVSTFNFLQVLNRLPPY
jgi:hypothetical protein